MINNWIMMKVLGPKARLWWEVAEKELGDEKYCVGTLLDMAMLLQKNCAEMGNDSKAVEFGKMIGILRSNGAFTEDERTRFRVEDFPDPFVNSGGIRLKLQPDKHDIDRNPALYDQVCDDSDFFKNFYEPEKNKNEVY
jgi:hypothetical protein